MINDSANGPGVADDTAAAAVTGAAGAAAKASGAAAAQMKASNAELTELRTMIYSFNEVLWVSARKCRAKREATGARFKRGYGRWHQGPGSIGVTVVRITLAIAPD
jgi:hypothetical protein